MKYLSRLFVIASAICGLTACTDTSDIISHDEQQSGDMQVNITFSMGDRAMQTRSKVSGTEDLPVHSMQLVCFDANGQYLGLRNATVTPGSIQGTTFVDKGTIKGTVPQNTARIHFIANRDLPVTLSHAVGTAEKVVMKSTELSTAYNDADHQEVCYWGYHIEDDAEDMESWLNPEADTPTPSIVYMIRDRAKIVLSYDPTGAHVPVTKIEWLIHNGRERGYLAPAETSWTNTGYYGYSTHAGHENELISTAGMNEYSTSNRYSLWTSDTENDEDNFDVAYQSTGTYTSQPQFLFEDSNEEIDDLKVIIRVTYTVNNAPLVRYHVLRLNKKDEENPDENPPVLYDIIRNDTYYINCKLLNPDVAFYETLKDAIDGNEFVNAEVEVDRSIPDIDDAQYTLQIKLPHEGTSIVLNTEGEHTMDYVFRYVNDVNTSASTDPDDFEVYWEKPQTFCEEDLEVTYNETTKQFTITATVKEGQLKDYLQDEWIVVKHNTSHLKRYIHVYVINEFRYVMNPKLTAEDNGDYLLSFQLPPMEHTQFLPDGTPDPNELIYPATLYPIDVKFTTNTLNAYGTTLGTTNYGLFGVSVESTSQLTNAANFETGYNTPVSSTNYNADRTHWYYQQEDNYWDFWYTYSLKTYPTDGIVNIYFKDVRNHISYATVADVGLFLYVEYFGKNYSVPVYQQTNP